MSSPFLVDVVLPLALPGAFTYALPESLAGKVTVGSRVVVPLGKRKQYTAIVVRCPGTPAAAGIQIKEILEVVDEAPLLLPAQLEMWRWMAHYYMCTPGEVMKAALPSGLKLESEAFVVLPKDRVADDEADETDDEEGVANNPAHPPVIGSASLGAEQQIFCALADHKPQSIEQLQKMLTGVKGVLPALRRLIESGEITVQERLSQGFVAKKETHVRLAEKYRDNETAQHFLLDSLRRSERQKEVVMTLIEKADCLRSELNVRIPGAAAALAGLKKKGVVELLDVVADRLKTVEADPNKTPSTLSKSQSAALADINAAFEEHDVCLLHGVTSSGKTEVYTELINHTLAAGKQVLYLVPEIALTTQLTERLGRVFGEKMGVYHSKFPDAERVEMWQRQLSPRAFPLIVGVRSSLFLPFQNLGLIIVDEEHETSYKQQDPAPRYNARDTAIVLAQKCGGAKVLLGTATPALETYFNATRSHKYGLSTLTERFGGVNMPEIVVEDVKELRRKKLMKTALSPRLIEEVRAAIDSGEQAILFLNRRGYAPVLECRSCGWTPRCQACDVPLTFHQKSHRLVCHYCGASHDIPRQCPNCGDTDLRDIGYGTERIEETMAQLFPAAHIARMDLDTTQTRSAYEHIIRDFQTGKTNLLVGTQMVTKGLDFEHVRVVGIINADQMLNQPNFRAFERAFQMMSQVAGRAGRRGKRGLVVLQTRQPDLGVVKQVVENDYETLFKQQIVEREQFLYPPFVRIIDIYLKHRNEDICSHAADSLAYMLRPYFGDMLLGPDRPSVGRVQYFHIRKLMLKIKTGTSASQLRQLLLSARNGLLQQPAYKSVNIYFDVDPM